MANNRPKFNNLLRTPKPPNPNPKIPPISFEVNSPAFVAKPFPISQELIRILASKTASQPLHYSDPNVWGVLTAISTKARQDYEGINMLLTSDEHVIGRIVTDTQFQISSNQVSQHHCKIYRKKVAAEDADNQFRLFTYGLKDTSTNGTYLNWEKLKKIGQESRLHHGDIVSLVAPPHHEYAFAFVFREVLKPTSATDGLTLKRKAEELCSKTKRLRGIGIGASEGPMSLDDFQSLQLSNAELKMQLEDQVATIDQLRHEQIAAVELHKVEKKNLKESISKTYLDELKEMRNLLEAKQKELAEVHKITSEQKHAMADLSGRLNASMQSCTEANEFMRSQETSISDLKVLLDKEREQRKEDQDKAAANLTASVQRVKTEAQEKLKQRFEASLRREMEQQEIINKFQELEKERCSVVEILRFKLEDTRQKLFDSDNKVRQLETKLSQEQQAASIGKQRVEELGLEKSRVRKELESEKASREEAWAKVSAIELQLNAATRDLELERRGLKASKERIMLRETQLRAFYSTTEEISVLFAKKREQLKLMQKTLEDEENYENELFDINQNLDDRNEIGYLDKKKETSAYQSNSGVKATDPSTPAKRQGGNQVKSSDDKTNSTEEHDCDTRNQENRHVRQEHMSVDHGAKGAFGSEIDGLHNSHVTEGDTVGGTERVLETESQGLDQNINLNKSAGDTMQIDDDTVKDVEKRVETDEGKNVKIQNTMEEDTEAGDAIKTANLLTSEVSGSWACSTAPSCHGENESPATGGSNKRTRSGERGALHDSANIAAESQIGVRWTREHRALAEMIGVVAPEMKNHFGGTIGSDNYRESDLASDSDTQDCTDDDDKGANRGSESDTQPKGRRGCFLAYRNEIASE